MQCLEHVVNRVVRMYGSRYWAMDLSCCEDKAHSQQLYILTIMKCV